MKLNLKTAAVVLLLCAACSNVKETPKGLKYTVVRKGEGTTAKPGEYLIVSILLKDPKDSALFDTRKSEFPSPIVIPDTSAIKREDGIEEVFRLVKKGDSVTFKIPAKTLYEKTFHQPLPPKQDPNSEYSFSMGVKNIITQEEFMKLQKEVNEKQNEKMKKLQAVQLGKDTVAIDSFLRTKNINALTTRSGLRYVVKKKGTGPNLKAGKTAKVYYAGSLLSGQYFDTNIESVAKANGVGHAPFNPVEFPVGQGRVIRGFDEAFLLMNKGSEITVYIPSTLGWGSRRASEIIKANAIVVFDIRMLDYK